jgi:hypothetical protein
MGLKKSDYYLPQENQLNENNEIKEEAKQEI